MKTVTLRLRDELVAQIDAESKVRMVSRSDVVRERLTALAGKAAGRATRLAGIADLVGAVDGLPPTLSGRRKASLQALASGRKRPR